MSWLKVDSESLRIILAASVSLAAMSAPLSDPLASTQGLFVSFMNLGGGTTDDYKSGQRTIDEVDSAGVRL